MENIVYNELLIRGYNVDVGVVDIFDKDKEGKRVRKQLEVDFVVNQGFWASLTGSEWMESRPLPPSAPAVQFAGQFPGSGLCMP